MSLRGKLFNQESGRLFVNAIAKKTFIAMVSLALFYFIFLESSSFYLTSMSFLFA